MIQNTRGAQRYGRSHMSCATRRSKAAMLLPRSQRPHTRARRHIPRRQIRPGSEAPIFMLHAHRARRRRRKRCVTTAACLDTGLLVRADHTISRGKCRAMPAPLVQIEHAGGFALKVRIAREDPTAVRPGTDRILGEPAPQRRLTDTGHKPALDHLAADLRHAPARQWYLIFIRQLAGQGLNGYDETGGKRAPGAPCGIAPPSLAQ